LSVNTPSLFFSCLKYKYLHFSTNIKGNKTKEITLLNQPLGYSSLFKKSKISLEEKKRLILTPRVQSILIGLLLSDGWLQKRNHWNPRFGLKQSIINFPYLWVCYNELGYLCSGDIYLGKAKLRGKLFYNISFQTRQLECFIELYNLFYINVNGKKIKIIKPDLFFYMDYIVLAHWIQGDGSKKQKGLELNTQGFNLNEVILLANILRIKFDLKPTLHKSRPDSSIYSKVKNFKIITSSTSNISNCEKEKNKINYKIYINGKDLNKIRPLILPYFVDHFVYKISGYA
jgi:hypothetical protein